MDLEVVILNYKGEQVLYNCVKSFVDNLNKERFLYKITVLDNNSDDDFLIKIQKEFKEVKIFITKISDYLFSYNEYVKNHSKSKIVALVSNDVILESGSLEAFINIFKENKDAFLAGPQIWTYGKDRYEGARAFLRFHRGYFDLSSWYEKYNINDVNSGGPILASGPFMVFRRDRFLELGGFDRYYYPGRSEDIDIGYRGWKKGYKGYYVPEVKVSHLGSYSFNKEFSSKGNDLLGIKNQYKFMYKNIADKSMRFQMWFWLIIRLVRALILLKMEYVEMLLKFIFITNKIKDKSNDKYSDKELLKIFGGL